MFRKTAPPSGAPRREPANGISVTDAGPCQKSVRLRLDPEAIQPVRAAVISEFQKQATLAGFRKGKAPVHLVERQYAQAIQEELLHRITKQSLERAVTEHQLRPVGPFEVHRADLTADGLQLEATVEVEPLFELAQYKQIRLTRPSAEVTPQEMEQGMASVQDSMAQMEPAGEGQPKQRNVPPLDDELAKDLGFESLERLRTHVGAKLREQKRAAQAEALEDALCDELLKRHAMDVPPKLIAHQAQRLTQDFKARLLLAGIPEVQLEDEVKKFTEQLRDSAQRRVKLGFILDRIAAQESITVSEGEVVERLWQLARRWNKDPAEVRKMFDARGLWPSVMTTIRQEKTIRRLLSEAAITDAVPASLAAPESATR